jgi:hypothetical protein
MPTDIQVTTEILWRGALMFALMDIPFVAVLAWRIKPSRFRQLRWELTTTAAIFYGAIWLALAVIIYWDSVYRYFFPDWMRWLIPFLLGLLNAVAVFVAWWSTSRLKRFPIIGFCFCGGLWGMLTHIWAVSRGIVDNPPMLQGANPVAAVVIAIFEFIFYWCIILSLALALWHATHWLKYLTNRPLHTV